MRIVTKKSIAFLIAQCLLLLLLLSKRHLCISISWKNSFHFMTQKYPNFRCRVERTGKARPFPIPKINVMPQDIK
jgi:hypothetical protein